MTHNSTTRSVEAGRSVLVTGTTGFVGKHLAKFLEDRGDDIFAVERSAGGFRQSRKTTRVIRGDLSDEEFMSKLDAKVDAIVHAATNSGRRSPNLYQVQQDNIESVRNLLAYATRVGCRQFINLSSVSVHGDFSGSVLDRDAPLHGTTPYGASKLAAENLLRLQENLDVFSIRLPAVVGSFAPPHWLSTLLMRARQNKKLTCYNPQFFFNNVVHVDDLCQFVSHLIDLPDRSIFSAFPIASAEALRVRDVLQVIRSEARSFSRIELLGERQPHFIIDDNFARERYGFTSITTREALQRFVRDELAA